MGYLTLMSLLGRHLDEAFSSLRIEDYKNFLRLHIDKTGTLTMYAVGIDKVPKDWKEDDDFSHCGSKKGHFTPSRWKPAKPMPIKLIDLLVLPPRASAGNDKPKVQRSVTHSFARARTRDILYGH